MDGGRVTTMTTNARVEWTALIILLVSLGIYSVVRGAIRYEREHPCIRSHYETGTMPPSVTFINSGGVMIPITNPGYEYVDTVCDERR